MKTTTSVRLAVLLAAFLVAGWAAPARAETVAPGCDTSVLPSGAFSLICIPPGGWNGELVVYEHGYVSADQPLMFANLTLPDGTSVPGLIESLGFAFATTSYRQNGLAIVEGVDDTAELLAAFNTAHGAPTKTYITGVSEGGLVATLAAERMPGLVTGAFAACGPIGSFQGQLDYVGDMRVLFNYYFPGVLPGSAVKIDPNFITQWSTVYLPAIVKALESNPARALELVKVAHAAFDPTHPATIANSIVDLLWYNVFGTADAITKLGGVPYDNRLRWYFGSSNDIKLNLSVERIAESSAARKALQAYETNGDLTVPLVSLHTIGDDVIPFWHEALFELKLDAAAKHFFTPIPVVRYGHCNFTTTDILSALTLLTK